MKYTVNGQTIAYESTGERGYGDDTILLRNAIDLTNATNWSKTGYTVAPFLAESDYETFEQNTYSLLLDCWTKAGLKIPPGFQVQDYHKLVSGLDDHLRAVNETKLIPTTRFPVPISVVEERISTICRTPLRALNPFDGQSVFHFRVIRPLSGDNNPLHRDVWLDDYDDCINLYIPVAGSNAQSSLIVVPESHHWPESHIEKTKGGAHIGGLRFNVPAVTGIKGAYRCDRPDPHRNEVLVFSPYLLHGGALNLNEDATRVSIELRLWKRS